MFINKHGTSDSCGVWFDALKDLTPKALESGIDRLNKLSAGDKFTTFPPNCLEFKALCLDFYSKLDLPKSNDAYLEIKNCAYKTNHSWSHPVIKLVAMRLPEDFLRREREHETYDLFKKAFDEVCDLVRQGHEIPDIDVQVMIERTPTKSIAQYHLQQMRLKLGASTCTKQQH